VGRRSKKFFELFSILFTPKKGPFCIFINIRKAFLSSNMLKPILTLLFISLGISVFSQSIARLDNSRISSKQLDSKITQLMKDASVTGMYISIFNNNKPVYNKTLGYKNSATSEPLQINTNIYGASLSKAVFAVLVLNL
jgi:D-alanyl-D-alanine-carboxypeptidase/D-alanyl-D-alanine-endopeptidase